MPLSDVLPPGASVKTRKAMRNEKALGHYEQSADHAGVVEFDSSFCSNCFQTGDRIYLATDHPWFLRSKRLSLDAARRLTTRISFPAANLMDRRAWQTFSYADVCTDAGLHYVRARSCIPDLKFAKILPDKSVARLSWRPSPGTGYRLEVAVGKTRSLPTHVSQLQVDLPGKRTVFYDAESRNGDCGSLVISNAGVVGSHSGFVDFNAFNTIPSISSSSTRRSPGELGLVRNHCNESARKPGKRTEAAVYDVAAPGSDYIGPNLARPFADPVANYVSMVTNPWSGSVMRLPDVNITPTCLAKFHANRTYELAPESGNGVLFGINSRLGVYSKYGPRDQTSVIADPSGNLIADAIYAYAPGTIMPPIEVAPDGTTAASYVWADDYGNEQQQTTTWTSSFRTLAMAARVRVVGLPSGQFMAPGKIYFAQVRCDRTDVPTTEQDFVVLERLGRATHVSVDAVRESGSKTFYAVPDSADKFNLSSQFWLPPGIYPPEQVGGQAGFTQRGTRTFPSATASNFADSLICPYDGSSYGVGVVSGTAISDPTDAAVADQTMMIIMGVFGLTPDKAVSLEVNYATVIEYIPAGTAPPGLEAAVQLPNSGALDSIFAACAVATELRPRLLQAPGDKTITTTSQTPSVASEAMTRGAKRSTGTLVSRRESWLDWLGDFSLNWGDFAVTNKSKKKNR